VVRRPSLSLEKPKGVALKAIIGPALAVSRYACRKGAIGKRIRKIRGIGNENVYGKYNEFN